MYLSFLPLPALRWVPACGLCLQPLPTSEQDDGLEDYFRETQGEAPKCLWVVKSREGLVSEAQVQLVCSSLVLNFFSTCSEKQSMFLSSLSLMYGEMCVPLSMKRGCWASSCEVSSSSDTCEIHIPSKPPPLFSSVSGKDVFTAHWTCVSKLWSGASFKTQVCCCLIAVSDSCATPWTVARQPPLSTGFPRQEYWSGLPFPPPGDLSNPGIKPRSPALTGRFFTTEQPGKPRR